MSYWEIIILANLIGFTLLFIVMLARPKRRITTITTQRVAPRLNDRSGE